MKCFIPYLLLMMTASMSAVARCQYSFKVTEASALGHKKHRWTYTSAVHTGPATGILPSLRASAALSEVLHHPDKHL